MRKVLNEDKKNLRSGAQYAHGFRPGTSASRQRRGAMGSGARDGAGQGTGPLSDAASRTQGAWVLKHELSGNPYLAKHGNSAMANITNTCPGRITDHIGLIQAPSLPRSLSGFTCHWGRHPPRPVAPTSSIGGGS